MFKLHDYLKSQENLITASVEGKTLLDFIDRNAEEYPDYPALNTPVICFWKNINNTAIGVAAITEDAAITPQSALKSSTKTVLMPTATVHRFTSLRNIDANIKSE